MRDQQLDVELAVAPDADVGFGIHKKIGNIEHRSLPKSNTGGNGIIAVLRVCEDHRERTQTRLFRRKL